MRGSAPVLTGAAFPSVGSARHPDANVRPSRICQIQAMTSNHRKTEREKIQMAYTYDRVLKDVAVDDAEMLVRDA